MIGTIIGPKMIFHGGIGMIKLQFYRRKNHRIIWWLQKVIQD